MYQRSVGVFFALTFSFISHLSTALVNPVVTTKFVYYFAKGEDPQYARWEDMPSSVLAQYTFTFYNEMTTMPQVSAPAAGLRRPSMVSALW